MPDKQFSFSIETNTSGVPRDWRAFPKQVMLDSKATITERLLAAHMLQLADVVDQIVVDLSHGTATAVVYESGIRMANDRR